MTPPFVVVKLNISSTNAARSILFWECMLHYCIYKWLCLVQLLYKIVHICNVKWILTASLSYIYEVNYYYHYYSLCMLFVLNKSQANSLPRVNFKAAYWITHKKIKPAHQLGHLNTLYSVWNWCYIYTVLDFRLILVLRINLQRRCAYALLVHNVWI